MISSGFSDQQGAYQGGIGGTVVVVGVGARIIEEAVRPVRGDHVSDIFTAVILKIGGHTLDIDDVGQQTAAVVVKIGRVAVWIRYGSNEIGKRRIAIRKR